jgi:DNA repair protein RadC
MTTRDWRATLHGAEFKVQRLQDAPSATDVMDTPERVIQYLRPQLETSVLYRPDVENFGIVHLTVRRKPIGFEIVSNGTLDTLLVHARNVFRSAILMNAAGIVLFHNHPSGDSAPSESDIRITRQLVAAGGILNIEVVDHLILGDSHSQRPFCSLRELGYFHS